MKRSLLIVALLCLAAVPATTLPLPEMPAARPVEHVDSARRLSSADGAHYFYSQTDGANRVVRGALSGFHYRGATPFIRGPFTVKGEPSDPPLFGMTFRRNPAGDSINCGRIEDVRFTGNFMFAALANFCAEQMVYENLECVVSRGACVYLSNREILSPLFGEQPTVRRFSTNSGHTFIGGIFNAGAVRSDAAFVIEGHTTDVRLYGCWIGTSGAAGIRVRRLPPESWAGGGSGGKPGKIILRDCECEGSPRACLIILDPGLDPEIVKLDNSDNFKVIRAEDEQAY